MDLQNILQDFESFKEKQLNDRFFKHHDLIQLLAALPSSFSITELGRSVKDKSINLVTWGNGPTKVMLWSQMHGDEATGTMALFDLFNFYSSKTNWLNNYPKTVNCSFYQWLIQTGPQCLQEEMHNKLTSIVIS